VITEPVVADLVTMEWRRRTEAEYISAAIAQQVTLWLIQLGGPPDLIRDGLRIAGDELTHSELSAAVATSAGGDGGPAVIDPATLSLAGGDRPADRLVSAILRYFCVGETIAVPLFRMLGQRCSVPIAREALDRILRDESRHRQFGWDVLDWALLTGDPAVRQRLETQAPIAVEEVVTAYVRSGDLADAPWHPELAAWGLAPPSDYAETATTALTGEITPRLGARGITIT
jgi:hypothetical protein